VDFWNAFILLAVFIPLTILWITCLVDLLFRRHDLSGGTRVIWVVFIIFLPVLGSLCYIAFGGMASQHVSESTMAAPRDDALRMTGRAPRA
jgi:hypothetical protein